MKSNFHLDLNGLMFDKEQVKKMDIRSFEVVEHSHDDKYDAFMTIYLNDGRAIYKSWKSLRKMIDWLTQTPEFRGVPVDCFWAGRWRIH